MTVIVPVPLNPGATVPLLNSGPPKVPPPPSVAPLLTVVVPAPVCTPLMINVPCSTSVGPLYVLLLLKIHLPVPVLRIATVP